MKNYILMLGIAAVSIGSYCAYAGNSATMTVTATIAHDVSLTKTGDISLGTITINPSATEETEWSYNDSGVPSVDYGDALVTADNATIGTFTANIPNPSACDAPIDYCGGLKVEGNDGSNGILNIFGGSDNTSICNFALKYSGSENGFEVRCYDCTILEGKISKVTPGSHSGTLTISYTPES
ncbi:MAG: hypothetical protein IJ689_01065 [Alphaproteobacteria bacterium]|nr:hypothetical protein [Alphaproteobacteria bacterium]